VNGMGKDFKWPQVWNTSIAIDQRLGEGLLGTLEFIYGKDINSIYVRNADLKPPVRYLPTDGRPYFSDSLGHELNPDGGAGAYVIDNSNEGYNYSITAQLRKRFDFGLRTSLAYTFLEAKSLLKSTEIASVLYAENPVKGDPNRPQLGYSQFGNRHRITGAAIYTQTWSENLATHFGLFLEVAEGNRFTGAGGNRYSFVYAGDVNGDGSGTNDLIYIPRDKSEINFEPYTDRRGNVVSADDQWAAFNSFIEQDDYLKENRGKIADRFGSINPWFFNIDLRVMQDISFFSGNTKHTFQISLDILNVPNLLNSDWGVRKVANSAATSPLELVGFNAEGDPTFNYKSNLTETFVDSPSLLSRWQMQLGIRYSFN